LVVDRQKTLRFFTNVGAMSPRWFVLLVADFKCRCSEREPGATGRFFTFLWVELEHDCLFVCLFVCLLAAGCYLGKDGDDVATPNVF